jgi:hypothetical protein
MVTDSLVNRWLLRRKLLWDDWPIWWDTVRWLLIVLKPSPELVKGRADAFVSLNSCGKRGETGLGHLQRPVQCGKSVGAPSE